MPGHVPIQLNTLLPSQSARPAPTVDTRGLAGAFAVLLRGVLRTGSSPVTTLAVGAKQPPVPSGDLKAAAKKALANVRTNDGSGPEDPVTEAAVPAGQAAASPGKLPVRFEGAAEAVPEDAGKAVAVGVADNAPAAPDGHGKPAGVPAGIIDKVLDRRPAGKARTHATDAMASSEETVSSSQPPVGPAVALGAASPAPVVPRPLALTPLPSMDAPAANATQVTRSGAPANPRPGLVDARSARETPPANPDQSDPPPAASAMPPVTDIKSDRAAVMSETPAQTIVLIAQPEVQPAVATLSPYPRPDQNQPAAVPDSPKPADQIAPALVGMLTTTDGVQSVTIRLQPAELGEVRIRIDRTTEGAAHVDITAERSDTLSLLQRDEPKLQQVLDQAGVPSNGRSVSFQVGTPDQVGASAARPDSMQAGSSGSGQNQSGGAWRQREDAPQDFGGGPGAEQEQPRARWFRAGLDITA